MLTDRLGYLLKHAQLKFAELNAAAMAPFGITGRELAVLAAIGDAAPQSQQEVSRTLGVDRTTMVALIDELEAKGLVERRPDPADRRRNTVVLSGRGRDVHDRAGAASRDAERRFLAALSDDDAARFRRLLRTVAGLTGP